MRKIILKNYIPEYERNYKELDAILDTENIELENVESELNRLQNNQYIETSDEQGIKRFEKLMSITPNPTDNLPERRFRVLTRWNDTIPYNYVKLITKIREIAKDDFEVIDNFNEYKLDIILAAAISTQIEAIQRIADLMIPANILVTIYNSIHRDLNITQKINIGMIKNKVKELK